MQVTGNSRGRRTEEEWREVVSQFEKSGQGVREFCRGREIQVASLQRWRQRLAGASAAVDFLPMTGAAPVPSRSSWSLELVLPNGCALRFQG